MGYFLKRVIGVAYLAICFIVYINVKSLMDQNTFDHQKELKSLEHAEYRKRVDDLHVGTINVSIVEPQNVTEIIRAPNICTQQQRLSHIDEMCTKYYGHPAKPKLIDNMTDQEVKRLGQEFFVVDEFRLLGCLSCKAGSTTWTLRLINNTESIPLKDKKHVNYEQALYKADKEKRVTKLSNFSPSEIRKRLKTYWKFLTVRHPLDRLVSAYNDKLVNDIQYKNQLAPKILSKYKNNTNKAGRKGRSNVSFKEFLQYIRDGGDDLFDTDGGHWHDLLIRCQPCTVDYDYMLRIETQDMDAQYIINHKMKGRGSSLKIKSWRHGISGKLPSFGIRLDEYREIPDYLFQDIVNHYQKDFDVYGYDFYRESDGKIVTQCIAAENGGQSCC